MDFGADRLDVAADAGSEIAPETMIEPGDLDQPRRFSVSAAVDGAIPRSFGSNMVPDSRPPHRFDRLPAATRHKTIKEQSDELRTNVHHRRRTGKHRRV